MLLEDLKPCICSDEVVLYEEYGNPMLYVLDHCGTYYDKEENEMYDTFGNRYIEAIYTDRDKLVIDISQV